MSGLTLVGGGASLLLLLVPPKVRKVHFLKPLCCDTSTEVSTCWDMTHNNSLTTTTTRDEVEDNREHLSCSYEDDTGNSIYIVVHNKTQYTNISSGCDRLNCSGMVEMVDDNWQVVLVVYY